MHIVFCGLEVNNAGYRFPLLISSVEVVPCTRITGGAAGGRKHRDGMVWNCGKKTSSLNSTRLQFFLTVLLPLCSSVLGFRYASFFFFYYNEFQFFLTICKIFFICSHVYASFRDNDIDYIYTCSVSGCWPCTYELVKNYLFTNFDNLEVNIYIY